MSGSQNSSRIQKGATAKVGTVLLQTDNEGKVASNCRDTANNCRYIGLIPLRDRCGSDDRESGKADNERLRAHGEQLYWIARDGP